VHGCQQSWPGELQPSVSIGDRPVVSEHIISTLMTKNPETRDPFIRLPFKRFQLGRINGADSGNDILGQQLMTVHYFRFSDGCVSKRGASFSVIAPSTHLTRRGIFKAPTFSGADGGRKKMMMMMMMNKADASCILTGLFPTYPRVIG
jgi:hypothetical protein